MAQLVIVGTVALDSIETPYGQFINIIGGSGVHSAMAASFFTTPALVGVVGDDFPKEHLDFLTKRSIDTSGIEIVKGGKTFRWEGYYEHDMNQAHTRNTFLNVLTEFNPKIPKAFHDAEYLFLANLDPDLQLKVLAQMKSTKFVVMDSMNYWIESKRETLLKVMSKVDVVLLNDGEIRELMRTPNIVKAARAVLETGCKYVIIKKGEHGAILFHNEDTFAMPSFPLDNVQDPTGAGDSFAGGFVGYLTKTNDLSYDNLRKAVVVGSTMASFNVEDFSLNRLKTLKISEINSRIAEFKNLFHFEEVNL
jgi:sugar/nucleoside kinase (ribokinase family)